MTKELNVQSVEKMVMMKLLLQHSKSLRYSALFFSFPSAASTSLLTWINLILSSICILNENGMYNAGPAGTNILSL